MIPVVANLHGLKWTENVHFDRPTTIFLCDSKSLVTTELTSAGEQRRWTDPFAALHEIYSRVRSSANARAVGFLSYELGRLIEPKVGSTRSHDAPLFAFMMQDEGKAEVVWPIGNRADVEMTPTFTRDSYLAAVRRVKSYIEAGDVFQINLAQRFSIPMKSSVREVDARLREAAPANYGALIQLGDFALISNSPELFFQVTPDRKIITRPIKGTRPIAPGMKKQLIASPKDQAELAMIVDLERNDLGRICEIGSVKVTEPRAIETHPTVYHSVATIEGKLKREVGFVEILRAMFPCGSITGAPKIRAMQIIDELEPVPRGPYCGAIGYLASDGTMEFNVAIRTIIVQNNVAQVSVGGGIVADSDPGDEYEETLVKAKAMFAALGV